MNSQISIIDQVGRFGLRKAIHYWKFRLFDLRTIRESSINVTRAFIESRLGVAPLEDYILGSLVSISIAPHPHHIGTTPIATSERFGIFGLSLRIFGPSNLNVAGSAIF